MYAIALSRHSFFVVGKADVTPGNERVPQTTDRITLFPCGKIVNVSTQADVDILIWPDMATPAIRNRLYEAWAVAIPGASDCPFGYRCHRQGIISVDDVGLNAMRMGKSGNTIARLSETNIKMTGLQIVFAHKQQRQIPDRRQI